MTKALITGISGFAGSFLAEHLISTKKYKVNGTYLTSSSLKNLSSVKKDVELTQADLLKKDGIEQLIESLRPDVIFHLAALPGVGSSFSMPAQTIINNVVAQVHLLEVVRKLGLDCRILIVSSADVYGKVIKEDLPIDEETKFNPGSAYAVSKITQDFLGLQYFSSYDMKIIRVRPFNHVGPRQSAGFVIADFAQKIVKIEKGLQEPFLSVGNLDSQRDFTDVRDMAKAYELAVKLGKPGDVYNIGSGKAYGIAEILRMFLKLTNTKITIKKDADLLRPQDSLERVCDNSKFVKLTGWKPEINIEQTLKDTLDYWRKIV